MLAILSYIAYSGSRVEVSTPSNTDACFDFTYYTSKNKERATTKNNQGFFVAYRVHEGDAYSGLQLVKYSDQPKSEYNDLVVEFYQQTVNENLELTFNITNKGYFPKTFDLGLFADIDYYNDDKATLRLLNPKHAFQVENQKNNLFFTVFINNPGRWDPVDTLLLGEMSDEEADEISEMPFFVNGDKTLTSGDSVVAFSWQNKTVRPDETIQLGFLAHSYKDIPIAPGVIDQTVIKPSYEPNENIDIVFNVTDFDGEENLEYTITTSTGETINEPFALDAFEYTQQFTRSVSVGANPIFTYTISAKDSRKVVSNTVTKNVFVYPQPVVETIADSLKPKYSLGQTIGISVEVTSQNTFSLKYYFDDGRILTANEKTSARKVEENVKTFSIPITSEITADKSHTLTYYVEDENGAQSEKQVHTFEYTSQPDPEPEPQPQPEPEPTNDNKPEPEPQPEPEPTNDNKPEPKPEPQPEPEQTEKTETVPSTSTNQGNGVSADAKSGDVDKSSDKSMLGIIIGCICAGVAVVVIIVVVAVFLIKKKSAGEGSVSEDEVPSQTADNHYFEE